MKIKSLAIPDVKLVSPKRFHDDRGYFEQSYHCRDYENNGIKAKFVQDNHSISSKGVLRGLHYQINNSQAKLVSVLAGSVFDVAVDLRQSSPYFGKWVGAELSSDNGNQLFIPRGFAHGFLVLSDSVSFFYKCDAYYSPEDEVTLRWDDPDIGVIWPHKTNENLVVSEKDNNGFLLKTINSNLLFD
tara:strand:- start:2780 stop:3337 length:558 start_codon:yes stop_codon:yes gene_type:complete